MKKLFQKILSIILAVFIPTATASPMTVPVMIDENTVSASSDYIFGGTNYGTEVRYLKDENGLGGWLYSNGEIIFDDAPTNLKELIVPDEIDGYPVTAIADRAFASEPDFDRYMYRFNSVIIGDNVRYIGNQAFAYIENSIELIVLGKNVEEIGYNAFELANPKKFVWNDKIKILHSGNFGFMFNCDTNGFFPLPESIEHFGGLAIPEKLGTWVIRENVKYVSTYAISCYNCVVLNINMEIATYNIPYFLNMDTVIYCLENSTIHQKLKSGEITNEYHLIENAYLTSDTADIGDDLTISGLPQGLTEETIGQYLNVEGEAEIRVADETVKTGTKIELVNVSPEFVYKTYTASVNGDINGDGSVNTSDDTAAMRKIITGSDSEFSEANKKAADLNGDGLINSTDLILMKSMQN